MRVVNQILVYTDLRANTMKTITYRIVTVVLLMFVASAAGCGGAGEACKKASLFEADFEDGRLDRWEATDPKAWQIEDGRGGKVLSLFGASDYEAAVRSPFNINLVRGVEVDSFVLEVKMRSTTKDYGHRDMCLFFGHQDPIHFYYVHIANQSDAHANSIFVVDGEPRVSIAKTRTEGTKWDENWHTVRLVRDVKKGTIEVFFDDGAEPIMTAVDSRFKAGRIGVGSFDDTGLYDDVRLWSK